MADTEARRLLVAPPGGFAERPVGMLGNAEFAMLRHLAQAGQELFRDDEDYETYLKVLRALADEGWIELEIWPQPGRFSPLQRRRRFAIARIVPAGRLAISAMDLGEPPPGPAETTLPPPTLPLPPPRPD